MCDDDFIVIDVSYPNLCFDGGVDHRDVAYDRYWIVYADLQFVDALAHDVFVRHFVVADAQHHNVYVLGLIALDHAFSVASRDDVDWRSVCAQLQYVAVLVHAFGVPTQHVFGGFGLPRDVHVQCGFVVVGIPNVGGLIHVHSDHAGRSVDRHNHSGGHSVRHNSHPQEKPHNQQTRC